MKKTIAFMIVLLVLAGIALRPVDVSVAYSEVPPAEAASVYYEDSYQ